VEHWRSQNVRITSFIGASQGVVHRCSQFQTTCQTWESFATHTTIENIPSHCCPHIQPIKLLVITWNRVDPRRSNKFNYGKRAQNSRLSLEKSFNLRGSLAILYIMLYSQRDLPPAGKQPLYPGNAPENAVYGDEYHRGQVPLPSTYEAGGDIWANSSGRGWMSRTSRPSGHWTGHFICKTMMAEITNNWSTHAHPGCLVELQRRYVCLHSGQCDDPSPHLEAKWFGSLREYLLSCARLDRS
jgi:hypothetical protein